ncbi:hypothetical protein P3T29_003312 [Kitasatospora sp. MAP5-34]|nr:hypothetical protein [Kitasatospora sp. MAP5-34]
MSASRFEPSTASLKSASQTPRTSSCAPRHGSGRAPYLVRETASSITAATSPPDPLPRARRRSLATRRLAAPGRVRDHDHTRPVRQGPGGSCVFIGPDPTARNDTMPLPNTTSVRLQAVASRVGDGVALDGRMSRCSPGNEASDDIRSTRTAFGAESRNWPSVTLPCSPDALSVGPTARLAFTHRRPASVRLPSPQRRPWSPTRPSRTSRSLRLLIRRRVGRPGTTLGRTCKPSCSSGVHFRPPDVTSVSDATLTAEIEFQHCNPFSAWRAPPVMLQVGK